MHLQKFCKIPISIALFFYIIHLDDTGLLFTLTSQGFSNGIYIEISDNVI